MVVTASFLPRPELALLLPRSLPPPLPRLWQSCRAPLPLLLLLVRVPALLPVLVSLPLLAPLLVLLCAWPATLESPDSELRNGPDRYT